MSVLNGHAAITEYLLGEKADFTLTNKTGKKAVDYARKANMKKLFEDAEKGVFNAEDNNLSNSNKNDSSLILKKKGLNVDQQLITVSLLYLPNVKD